MPNPTLSPAAQAEINAIAAQMDIATLETRNLDSLDFHERAVWVIKAALEAAYLAGMADRHRAT